MSIEVWAGEMMVGDAEVNKYEEHTDCEEDAGKDGRSVATSSTAAFIATNCSLAKHESLDIIDAEARQPEFDIALSLLNPADMYMYSAFNSNTADFDLGSQHFRMDDADRYRQAVPDVADRVSSASKADILHQYQEVNIPWQLDLAVTAKVSPVVKVSDMDSKPSISLNNTNINNIGDIEKENMIQVLKVFLTDAAKGALSDIVKDVRCCKKDDADIMRDGDDIQPSSATQSSGSKRKHQDNMQADNFERENFESDSERPFKIAKVANPWLSWLEAINPIKKTQKIWSWFRTD